jgi:hypothetical protein
MFIIYDLIYIYIHIYSMLTHGFKALRENPEANFGIQCDSWGILLVPAVGQDVLYIYTIRVQLVEAEFYA